MRRKEGEGRREKEGGRRKEEKEKGERRKVRDARRKDITSVEQKKKNIYIYIYIHITKLNDYIKRRCHILSLLSMVECTYHSLGPSWRRV